MLPGLQFLKPLLIAHLLSYATFHPAPQPLEDWRTTYCCSILQEGPQLHAAYKAREDVGKVEVHEGYDLAVDDPCHDDSYEHKSEF